MTTAGLITWDHPDTVRYYRAFCQRHTRYQSANQHLVARARLRPGQQVLDLAAGLGHTARAVLPFLGPAGRVTCVEPADAMRRAGQRAVGDRRVTWARAVPDGASFDRILCSAAIWQMLPLDGTLRDLAARLKPRGLVGFNIPAVYLGQPDPPGHGDDPLLVDIPRFLMQHSATSCGRPPDAAPAASAPALPSLDELTALLSSLDLRPRVFSFRWRMTQRAYRDWLKIPLNTNRLLAHLAPAARARLLSAAYRHASTSSWRYEYWLVFTASRR